MESNIVEENNKLNLIQIPSLIVDRLIAQIIDPQLNSLNVKDLNEAIEQISTEVNQINQLKLVYSNLLCKLPRVQLERLRLLIGSLAFKREFLDERIKLSLSSLTTNKVRVDRLLCGGYVAQINFKLEDRLIAEVTAIFDTKTQYTRHFTELADADSDHRVDVIWHSEPFSINREQPYLMSNYTQTIFMPNVIMCNMVAIHSKEFREILKSILASSFSYRAGLNTDYTNYLDNSIFTLPIFSGDNPMIIIRVATVKYQETRELYFYSRHSTTIKSEGAIYNPPLVWNIVADLRFSPPIRKPLSPMLKPSRTSNIKVEYQLAALGLQSDAAVHELLQSNSSIVNFDKISPLIDPIAKKWPWTIKTLTFYHAFTQPQEFVQGETTLQQHIFPFTFTLE